MQAMIPFSEDELEYIARLDAEADMDLLRRELPSLREESLRTLQVATILLQRCAAAGDPSCIALLSPVDLHQSGSHSIVCTQWHSQELGQVLMSSGIMCRADTCGDRRAGVAALCGDGRRAVRAGAPLPGGARPAGGAVRG